MTFTNKNVTIVAFILVCFSGLDIWAARDTPAQPEPTAQSEPADEPSSSSSPNKMSLGFWGGYNFPDYNNADLVSDYLGGPSFGIDFLADVGSDQGFDGIDGLSLGGSLQYLPIVDHPLGTNTSVNLFFQAKLKASVFYMAGYLGLAQRSANDETVNIDVSTTGIGIGFELGLDLRFGNSAGLTIGGMAVLLPKTTTEIPGAFGPITVTLYQTTNLTPKAGFYIRF